jgi:hypothetical protein
LVLLINTKHIAFVGLGLWFSSLTAPVYYRTIHNGTTFVGPDYMFRVGHRDDTLRVFKTGRLDDGTDAGADAIEEVQRFPADLGRAPDGLCREFRRGDVDEYVRICGLILTICESMVVSNTS